MITPMVPLRQPPALSARFGAMLLLAWPLMMAALGCGGSPSSGAIGTEESEPILSIEVPAEGSLLLPFRVAGWAIDRGSTSGTAVDRIEVLDGGCDGRLLGAAEHGIERPDIVSSLGERFAKSGWQFVIESLSVGDHVIAVQLYSTLTPQPLCKTLSISVL